MKLFTEYLYEYNNITKLQIGIYIWVIILGTYLIFDVYPKLRARFKSIKNIGEWCGYSCSSNICKTISYQSRGSNYHDTKDINTPAKSGCLITGWELSHFVLHIFIAYYLNFTASLGLNIGYEIFEYNTCDCHSLLDILYNTCGGLLGIYIKYYQQV